MLGNMNYYIGQFFDMLKIISVVYGYGCMVGFDCVYGVGNVLFNLYESGVDFVVWCIYKYFNLGFGSMVGCFVYECYVNVVDILCFEGWWGYNKIICFGMCDDFDFILMVEVWQLSNLLIFLLVVIKVFFEIFVEVGMDCLWVKVICLMGYLEFLLC